MDNLITTPIPASADLFQVADMCATFAIELLESADATKSLALQGRLSCALTALRVLCDADLPPHLIEQLTADKLPEPCVPDCWFDSYALVEYTQALTQALLSCTLPCAVTEQITGLLHDLIILMVEHLKQPYLEREVAE
ncbi:hypothetical protein [Superficieibacter sp. 1612_C1]|uniref:hypothetical protein n=1 Tax=Superficieibacter sp. 1612_C1 TaxID=2780382 RepID=UPI0018842C1E|nr:hypothetical protein [Superficieibacter sp. 1612_C1]